MLAPFLTSVARDSFTIATKYLPFKYGGGSKCVYLNNDTYQNILFFIYYGAGVFCFSLFLCSFFFFFFFFFNLILIYNIRIDCDYDSVKGALVNSLSRLGLDSVDIYYCHRIPSLEKAIEFAKSCKQLQDEGLIKIGTGLSEISGKWLRQVHEAGAPIYCVQQEWSLATRNLEEELVPVCAELVWRPL